MLPYLLRYTWVYTCTVRRIPLYNEVLLYEMIVIVGSRR